MSLEIWEKLIFFQGLSVTMQGVKCVQELVFIPDKV